MCVIMPSNIVNENNRGVGYDKRIRVRQIR